MQGVVEAIYVSPRGGEPMRGVAEVEAAEGFGLIGDRYSTRVGFWTGVDECEVTLIEAEDMEAIEKDSKVKVTNGEHRRNLVTRGVRLLALSGKRFQIGEVVLEFDRPRPPCSYIQSLTEPGMTRALARTGGVCARVVKSGWIRVDDLIKVID
jgi:MOSC domain-containing protein YiiM